MNVLLTDIDDACLRWSTHFRKVFREKTGHYPSSVNSSEMRAYSHVNTEELERYITDFNQSDHFENLKPKSNSEIIIPKLKAEGWTIIGITACGNDPVVKDLRWKNLNKIFGDGVFSDVRFVEWYECKSVHLKDFENCPFIEDNIQHAETAHQMGHKSMIIHRSYRKQFQHPEIPYVRDWNEIYQEITK